MAKPGSEQSMGPNIASIQSLLNATNEWSEASQQHEGNDRSALAVMCAVMATPSEALKSDVVGSLVGNFDKSVTSLGCNITTQFSIFSPLKDTSIAFGFPILFDRLQQSGAGQDGGDISHGGGDDMISAPHEDGFDDRYSSQQDPWHFNEFPHANEEIAHASRGLSGVSHEDDGRVYSHSQDISPTPSPGMQQGHDEIRGL